MQSGVLAFSCHFSRLQIQSETFADNNHHTCFAGSFLLFNPYRSLEHEQMSGNNTKTKSFELCALMTDLGLLVWLYLFRFVCSPRCFYRIGCCEISSGVGGIAAYATFYHFSTIHKKTSTFSNSKILDYR